jgi:hypothetical protein
VARLIYDAGALLAAERGDKRMVELHRRVVGQGRELPVVPVVALAQAWRGGPQPLLSRLLHDCAIDEETESIGRAAGTACAAAGTSDVVDAIVVVTAITKGAAVVTSDPSDLRRLAAVLGRRLEVFVV